jgi:mannose PTS system EIID component
VTRSATPGSVQRVTRLPVITRLTMIGRLFAIQGSWNYEILLGNGIGFCVEPALRLLPGGGGGEAYRTALARQSAYFNAHPYLAAVAVGALARTELDGEPPARIERFRTALCGPLGSVGDRLVWAAWLPLCSLIALAAFGLGARSLVSVGLFLVLYNVGHVALRIWGLQTGWSRGMNVATALANPVLRRGPEYIVRVAAAMAGLALPLAVGAVIGAGRAMIGAVLVGAAVAAFFLVRLKGRAEGWRVALGVLSAFALFSVAS